MLPGNPKGLKRKLETDKKLVTAAFHKIFPALREFFLVRISNVRYPFICRSKQKLSGGYPIQNKTYFLPGSDTNGYIGSGSILVDLFG